MCLKGKQQAVQHLPSSCSPHVQMHVHTSQQVAQQAGQPWQNPIPSTLGGGPLTALLDFDWLVSHEEQGEVGGALLNNAGAR